MPIIFIIASLVTLIAALMVVTGKNLFHNALFLVLSFVGVAALYISAGSRVPGRRADPDLRRAPSRS